MYRTVAVVALAAAASAEVFFEEDFSTFDETKWITSEWKGRDGELAPFAHTAGEWYVDAEANKGIQTTGDLKHHAVSAALTTPFSNEGKTTVIQFSVKNEKKEYAFCGGGYIKLHPSTLNQKNYGGDDAYNIMFGPDLCGYDVSRIHLIFQDQKGENQLKTEDIKLDYDDKNEFTHLYTLILKPDGSYQVLFDNKEKAAGTLEADWAFPPKSHDDPADKKPADWVEETEIPDPEDSKPEGWDEVPERIPDPEASKPDEWDDEMDGDWEPATVDNPEYKGAWEQKKIANPEYKGEWVPKQIPNPEYSASQGVYADNAYVGFELWTVNNGTIFDNVLVTDDAEYAAAQAEKLWKPTADGEKAAKEAWESAKKAEETNPKDDDEEEVEEAPSKDEL